jgi:hypothetical protein
MKKSRISVNQNAIKTISVIDKTHNKWNYKLVHKKGDWYISLSKFRKMYYNEDVYQAKGLGCITYTESELIDAGNVIENNEVFIAPRVVIHYIDDTADIKYFKTFEEANDYFSILTNKFNLIEL